nr:MAG TPA: hypothetical protein [Caudoviricetes sp.]
MANNLWSNYTEKTATPVDADEVMARDSTDGKNKRLLFGTFWKWVAKKLNEATISELETDNKTIIGAINALNGNKVSYTKYVIINPAKESSLILDNASTYLVCYAGINRDNVENIGFSVVISRSSSETKGRVLDIKTEVSQIKLSLNENVLKITATIWGKISAIKL